MAFCCPKREGVSGDLRKMPAPPFSAPFRVELFHFSRFIRRLAVPAPVFVLRPLEIVSCPLKRERERTFARSLGGAPCHFHCPVTKQILNGPIVSRSQCLLDIHCAEKGRSGAREGGRPKSAASGRPIKVEWADRPTGRGDGQGERGREGELLLR